MRVRIDDPKLLPDLLAALTARLDAVVDAVGEHELEVGLLGSRTQPFARIELEERLRRWKLRHPGVRIELQEN
jgi:hypothetical protein